LQVHDFQADAGCCKWAHPFDRGETQAFAGAEQDDADAQFEQFLAVGLGQCIDAGRRPVGDDAFRAHDQVVLVLLMIDRNVVVTVGGEEIEAVSAGCMEFHFAVQHS